MQWRCGKQDSKSYLDGETCSLETVLARGKCPTAHEESISPGATALTESAQNSVNKCGFIH